MDDEGNERGHNQCLPRHAPHPGPWVHRDEPRLYRLMKRAHELGCPVDEDEVQAASSEDPVPETPYWYTSPPHHAPSVSASR